MAKNRDKTQSDDQKKRNYLIIISFSLFALIALGVGILFNSGRIPNPFDYGNTDEEVIAWLTENRTVFDLEGFENLADPNSYTQTEFLMVEGGIFQPGIGVVRIGNEIITTDDFNNYFFVHNQSIYYKEGELSEDDMNNALQFLKRESVLLQEYYERYDLGSHVLFLDTSRETKDYLERSEAYGTLVERFNLEHSNQIKGETISIWFYNILEPAIGAEAAQQYSQNIMEDLRANLASAEITMKEASEIILNDPELRSYDFSIEANAYNKFISENGFDVFISDEMNQKLKQMEAGELSEIILVEDTQDGQDFYPAFYTIIFVEEISGDGMTLDQVYENSVFKEDIEKI